MLKCKMNILFLVIGIISFSYSPAKALLIVDTGPGAKSGGLVLNTGQYLAAEFTTTEQYSIDEITGWMVAAVAGTGTIAIYDDGGDVPGAEKFSSAFSVSLINDYDWYGASSLGWNLLAGTYWVSFEVRSGDTFAGIMGDLYSSPLANEAVLNSLSGFTWSGSDGLDIGVKIEAEPIPEPTTMLLLGTGLVGVAGAARRRKKNQA